MACTLLRYARAHRAQETALNLSPDHRVEQSFGGPLGILIAGLGMCAFYTALIWINLLLGMFLTPLFLIPLTWVQDWWMARGKTAQA